MKNIILKLLMLDDHILIHRAKISGMFCVGISILGFLAIGASRIFVNRTVLSIHQNIEGFISNVQTDPQVNAELDSIKGVLNALTA